MIYSPPIPALRTFSKVPPRTVFAHEAQNFTRWLADNLTRLSTAIGIPLALANGASVGFGRFADLLARDERDGSLVVIENQLEAANDAHLGQIFAYLAGADAQTAVWVADRFSEAHRSTIRWLNAHTPLRFFAVQMSVVQINGSDLAAVFDVLERPSSRVQAPCVLNAVEPEPLKGFARAFWATHLLRHPQDAKRSRAVGERCRWRPTQPTGVVIGQLVDENSASVFLRGRRGVPLQRVLELLAHVADRLERWLGVSLHGDNAAILAATSKAIDLTDPSRWEEASDFLAATADLYDEALRDVLHAASAAHPFGASR